MLSDLLYVKIVGNKKITHKNILKKLIDKKCEGVVFLYFENLSWMTSDKNERENKKIWIGKTSWKVIFNLSNSTINKFTTNEITNKIALLFFILIYYFFYHIVQC